VNREHFRAFLWLRWRLRVNQFRKAGTLNAVLFFVFVVLVLIAAVGFAVAGFLVGFFALPDAKPPVVRLLVWDGVIGAFLFFWMIGLMTDLQRAEGLAIDKVLHLPVSPTGAFLINYLSSLVSLTLIAFLPGMVGLILGQVCAGSVAMLLALPLLAAFVLAVTESRTSSRGGWRPSCPTRGGGERWSCS
jgi:ABC-2 type transport system permease protein